MSYHVDLRFKLREFTEEWEDGTKDTLWEIASVERLANNIPEDTDPDLLMQSDFLKYDFPYAVVEAIYDGKMTEFEDNI